jgi:very-short-patch-repair endonuclease
MERVSVVGYVSQSKQWEAKRLRREMTLAERILWGLCGSGGLKMSAFGGSR